VVPAPLQYAPVSLALPLETLRVPVPSTRFPSEIEPDALAEQTALTVPDTAYVATVFVAPNAGTAMKADRAAAIVTIFLI
jgi:hypothetical protein